MAKSCSVDKVTKDKLVIILCGQDDPENKHRFYGSGCVYKPMKMRAENTIAQVYMHNKCGDPDFSKKLESASLEDAKLMEILSLCTDEKISFDQIYSSAKEAVSTTIQNQLCTPETKKLLAQNKINKKAWINQRNAISNNDLFTALGLKITKDEIIVPK